MGRKKVRIAALHSIQTKIMAVSLLIAVGTAVVSLIISFYAEINTIKETTEKYMEQYISFSDQEFNDMLKEAKKIILSVAMAQEFISPYLLEPGQEASYDSFQQKKQIKSFLSGFLSQKDYIEDIMLVTDDKEVYMASSDIVLKKELDTSVMQHALSSKNTELFYDAPTKTLLLCRPVAYCKGSVKTTVIVRLNYELITGVYNIEPLRSVVICLYLPDGQLFYTNARDGENEEVLGSEIMSRESSTGYVESSRGTQYYIRYVSGTSKMMMVSLIPQSILLKDARDLGHKFFLIGIGASVAAVLTAVYLSKKISANIKHLSSGMEAVRGGDLGVRMQINVPDEIGELADTFNVMMERIEKLMEEVKQKERMKREAEQDVLASQIEPHFLYNSINSIQYVANMREETEIEEVAKSLSELLRSVLSNHNEYITLWEEKEYIENYINIERFKYRKPFSVVWDVDEELWAYQIPKLLLQPVAENALIHGISSKEGDGVIHIKVYKEQREVVCKVMDNGKGMSEETIQKLMQNLERKDKAGFRRIGISNVFSRIQLIYGEEYGGSIYSCEGMFTCVELHLPLGGNEDGFDNFTD